MYNKMDNYSHDAVIFIAQYTRKIRFDISQNFFIHTYAQFVKAIHKKNQSYTSNIVRDIMFNYYC